MAGTVEKLSTTERRKALATLKGWQKQRGRDAITKKFTFKDFSTTFGWMSRVAMKAEQIDHHPEWFNVYNRVEVILTTHDASGISQLDIDMARFMDRIAPRQK